MKTDQHAYMHGDGESNPAAIAVSATIHCLVGCVIGETIGLILGVSLQWHPLQTAIVATGLAFITGFSLTLIPLVLKEKLSVVNSFKLVWLGESISIGVMELPRYIDTLKPNCTLYKGSDPYQNPNYFYERNYNTHYLNDNLHN